MKLSNNSIGMLVFIVLATSVFVLMALRPAVDGNAMNLGVPLSNKVVATGTSAEVTSIANSTPSVVTEAPIDAINTATDIAIETSPTMQASDDDGVTLKNDTAAESTTTY